MYEHYNFIKSYLQWICSVPISRDLDVHSKAKVVYKKRKERNILKTRYRIHIGVKNIIWSIVFVYQAQFVSYHSSNKWNFPDTDACTKFTDMGTQQILLQIWLNKVSLYWIYFSSIV